MKFVTPKVKEGLLKIENLMDVGISLFMLLCGVIYLSQAFKLKKNRVLFTSAILYPNNLSPEDCKDPDGYIKFIFPRLLFVGFAFVAFSVITVYLFLFGNVNSVMYL